MAKEFSVTEQRRTIYERIAFGLVFTFLTLYCISLVIFFSWGIMSSLKGHTEFLRYPMDLPVKWRFENYLTAFQTLTYGEINILGMVFNTIWETVLSNALSIISVCTTGYIFAKYHFKGKEIVFAIVIFTMTIPIYGNMAANYKLVYSLGIDNSPLFFITSLGGFGSNFLIAYAVFKGVPWSYAEAAFIDGCGRFRCYVTIMLPMIKGLIATFFIQGFIAGWNNYMTSLMYLPEFPTLALGLFGYRSRANYVPNDPVFLAGVITSMIPCVFIFSFCNGYITKNLTIGGLKG